MPGTFEDVIELLVPELRRRGIFWDGYTVPGGTYRENLNERPGQREPLSDHPAAGMIWRAPPEAIGAQMVNGWHEIAAENKALDPIASQIG